MKTRKIIFVHLLNDYSGSPKVLSQIIKIVKKHNCEVVLYTGKSGEGFLSKLTKNHYKFFYKRFNNKYLTLLSFIFSQVNLFFKLLKYKNEDVIIYINTMLPFGAGLAGKFMQKPVIYHIHETSLKPLVLKKFLRFIIQKTASKIIFVSNFLKEVESFKDKSQIVVYNALSQEFIETAFTTPYKHLHNDKFNVLMVCSLKDYKGIKEFIDIAFLCKSYNNIQFTLILNANKDEINNYFKNMRLSDNMTLLSKQDNIVSFYKNTSLLLNLSRVDEWVETFGLTILEAMAFGIPVIVPPIGGPAEIVRNNIEGYLISSYDIKEIANKIVELSKNEKKCLELSSNVRKRSEIFSEKFFEKEILNLLCNLNIGEKNEKE